MIFYCAYIAGVLLVLRIWLYPVKEITNSYVTPEDVSAFFDERFIILPLVTPHLESPLGHLTWPVVKQESRFRRIIEKILRVLRIKKPPPEDLLQAAYSRFRESFLPYKNYHSEEELDPITAEMAAKMAEVAQEMLEKENRELFGIPEALEEQTLTSEALRKMLLTGRDELE